MNVGNVSVSGLIGAFKRVRFALILLVIVLFVQIIMLRTHFNGRAAIMNNTIYYWLLSIIAIVIGLGLITAEQSLKTKWIKTVSVVGGRGIIYALGDYWWIKHPLHPNRPNRSRLRHEYPLIR